MGDKWSVDWKKHAELKAENTALKNELRQKDAKIETMLPKLDNIIFRVDAINAMVDLKSARIASLEKALAETACHTWNKKMTKTELDNLSAIYQRCDGRHEWKLGYKKGKVESIAAVTERIFKNEQLFVVEHPEYGKSEPFGLFWEEITFHNPKDCGMSVILKGSDICFSMDAKRFKLEILKEMKG
jgi:predicted RNase H-like nuclease (RuvC/YqgF family)